MGGRTLGVATAESCAEFVAVPYIATTVTQAVFIAEFPCIVSKISGRQRVNGGSGAQMVFYKCASGVAAASGTLLHSGVFDASSAGTADANQSLTMAIRDNRTLNIGDSINMVVSGTMTSAVGFIQLTVEPLA